MKDLKNRPWYSSYSPEMKTEINLPEKSLYTLLKESAHEFGERTAIVYEDCQITYQQLKENVDRLAGAWNELGLTKGERVGLMISNHPDYITAYYAAQRLGLTVVQINPRYTERELLHIIEDSGMNYLVAEEYNRLLVNQVKEKSGITFVFVSKAERDLPESLENLINKAYPLENDIPISVKEDVAVIQYTGGTTGKIKGAMLTHYNLVANVVQSHTMYGKLMDKGKEIVLAATPLYHVYAMTSAMNLGIYLGATILLIPEFKVNDVAEKIKKYQPTFFPGVPKMYSAFVQFPNIESYRLDSLKFCSSGSAPLPVEIIRRFESLTGAIIGEGFGLSEASPSTHRNPAGGIRKIGSIGLPFPGTDCRIVDDHDEILPINSVGELIIKGPQVMKGYWNQPEETSQSLRNGWLYTGDLAMCDEDGYFYIVGRKKEMIINGGFNIYPQEIESVLYEHPAVKDAAVVGIPDRDKGEIVKAYVVLKEQHKVEVNELKEYCSTRLARYKVPKHYEIRGELPRNTVGKLLKRKLIEEEKAKTSEVIPPHVRKQ
ncbi:long-chain fatty acid--CoA ligase [Halobacillus halophilus]|uniref:Long-chain-fatty-acid--CoA ligase n=1 Tax=Halobacillus halophilus (strain ATCC 35676 / DSM 2266 / JCM 20832 / KCTC 3685 / LMG 17431 / NBRC 102448 / NCIMB 2269) TaxID=866895 RepID=I0JIE3_HALH3|nr:long-chain fatty acid--CoA ligase [Halobacillus halophilus]ASF38095.1 long-chain fatty acid--CoA ligase [Halobacillus halophilus]CCG43911.1 long-chain-fatty-acid--CoA ligase [Halobacillus halophilus DSM 2266]